MVGGTSRDQFFAYASVSTFEDAVELAIFLAGTPASTRSAGDSEALRARGAQTAAAMKTRVAEQGGGPAPTGIVAGDLLDCVEPETAHHLYALGTMFGERSQPPTDLGGPCHRYEVIRELPDDVREGVAGPWFGQAGGGAMVVLVRPIRWYVDQGFLVELTPEPGDE